MTGELYTYIKRGIIVLLLCGGITSLYNGMTGNRRSWLKKKWFSIENFEKSQTCWNQAAVLALIFSIIIFAAQLENFNK